MGGGGVSPPVRCAVEGETGLVEGGVFRQHLAPFCVPTRLPLLLRL